VTELEERLRKELPRLSVLLADSEPVPQTEPLDARRGSLPETSAPAVASSHRTRRRVAVRAVAMSLLVCVVIIGAVALTRGGDEGRHTATPPTANDGRVVRPRDFYATPARAIVFVQMKRGASSNDLDAARRAVLASDNVTHVSVFDRDAIRREANRLLNGGITVDDAPTVRPPAPFIGVALAGPRGYPWSKLRRLPGVASVFGLSGNTPDLLSSYADCASVTAAGWTAEVDMAPGASPEQIAAVRTALEGHPGVHNVDFRDSAAAYTEFARIWRNLPDVVQRSSPDEMQTSFRFRYDGRQGDAIKAELETLGAYPVTKWRNGPDAGELTTFACSAYDNFHR
jgi:hypothetical protein